MSLLPVPAYPKALFFTLLCGFVSVAGAAVAFPEKAWGVFGKARPNKGALTSRYIENQLQVSSARPFSPGSMASPLLLFKPLIYKSSAMFLCPISQRRENHQSAHLSWLYQANIRLPFPRQSCCQFPLGDRLYLWTSQYVDEDNRTSRDRSGLISMFLLDFLLALCPPNIDPSSLSVMVAFAVGGLLGDTFFHLLPEIFVGEDAPDHVRFNMVEPNKNLLLGVAILVGFMTFVVMDKTIRIATGVSAHDHVHDHVHGQIEDDNEKEEEQTDNAAPAQDEVKIASGTETASPSLRNRKSPTENDNNNATSSSSPSGPSPLEATTSPQPSQPSSTSAQLGGYLNLIADFTHNITDGLALSSSFYASTTIGATTTVAVFFHEIPHEVGDFALLIQSGFSKRDAMAAQFVTALGALLGTVIGIAIQEFGGSGTHVSAEAAVATSSSSASSANTPGLLGTTLMPGDLLLPFTAGTFLYVATVSVIPELLEIGHDRRREIGKSLAQLAAAFVGAGVMLL